MRSILACVLILGACGGSDGASGDDAPAPDAPLDEDPIPDDAIYLDPVNGSATAPGTKDAPWPGLEATIAAGLLDTVADGKTLVLLDGNHGSASFEGEHATAVTMRAAPGATPQLGQLTLRKGSGWHVRGLTVSPAFAAAPYTGTIVSLGESGTSTDLTFEDGVVYTASDSTGWTAQQWMDANSGVLLGRNGTGLAVRRTHVYNVRFGITLTSFDSSAEGNMVNEFSGDGMRVTRDGEKAIDNVIKNVYVADTDGDDNHDDGIQCFLFNVGTGTVRDVTISGNVIVNREDDAQPLQNALQGIGFFDGPLVNFTVEDNVVFVDHWHAVSLYDAQGSRINHNVGYSRWNTERQPWVMLGQKLGMASGNTVHDNLAVTFDLAADATVDAANNTTVNADGAEQRYLERIAKINSDWGATFRDGAHR